MNYIVLHVGLFDGGDRDSSEESILLALEWLVDRNCRYLEQHPDTPKLYDSKVEYALPDQMTRKPDPAKLAFVLQYLKEDMGTDGEAVDIVSTVLQGCEIFRDIPTVYAKKFVDCDNLCAIRCAELRRAGVRAMPYITWRETPDGTTYHALVRHPDGTSEDPSILLGMGGESKARERLEERRKNKERYDTFVQAAAHLCNVGDMSPLAAGKKVDALGFLPRGGW